MVLQQALEQVFRENGSDAALSVVSAALHAHGVRSLIVAVDDQHLEPYVASTIGKQDITVPMVQGFVYVLLEQAGVPNPAPQAAMAANFVVKFVSRNVRP